MRIKGDSYNRRVEVINELYDLYVKTGLSNREILRRFIYPQYGISERTLYRILKLGEDRKSEAKTEC